MGAFVKNICDGLEEREWIIDKNILTATIQNPFGYLLYCIRTWLKIRNYKGIVFVQYVGISAIPIIFLTLIYPNLKVISNFHGSDGVIISSDNWFVGSVKRFLSSAAVRRSILTIYPSNYFYQKMLKFYPHLKGRDFLISPSGGVNLSVFNDDNSGREIDFIFAGRMVRGKGVHTAIKIVKSAIEVSPRTKFLFVGDGPEKASLLKFQRQYKVSNNIELVGLVKQAELASLLKTAKIFLFPSITESLGLTLIEAIDAGCIPIVMNNGAVSEIIPLSFHGKLVAESEPEFIEKSLAVLKLPHIERLCISRALKGCIEKYDRKSVLDTLSERLGVYFLR